MRIATRLGTLLGIGLLAIALASPASAHECFNTSRVDRANTVIAEHAHGWVDVQTSSFLGIFYVSCILTPGQDCGPTPPTLTTADLAYLQATSFDQLIGELLGFAPRSTAVSDLITFTDEVVVIANGCGVPTHFLTLSNAAAAGGAPNKVVTDGRGIDHFPDVYGDQLAAAIFLFFGGPAAC
jgi:hypothetical protein